MLAWIRHGEYAQPAGVPSAHLPYGLTPRGQDQARAAAHDVWQYASARGLGIDPVIDSSRLRRAWETAQLMARELEQLAARRERPAGDRTTDAQAFGVREFDELAERGLGAAANLTIAQIEAVLCEDPRFERPAPGWKRDPSYVLPLPGAESLEQAGRRVARHVLARMVELDGAAALKLFVGHGGAFRHAARELGLLSPDDVQRLTMRHGAPIYFDYQRHGAAGGRLTHTGGDWQLRGAANAPD